MMATGTTFKVDSDDGKVSVYIKHCHHLLEGEPLLFGQEFEIYAYDYSNLDPYYFEGHSYTGFSEILIDLFVWMKTYNIEATTSSFMKELKDAIAKSR